MFKLAAKSSIDSYVKANPGKNTAEVVNQSVKYQVLTQGTAMVSVAKNKQKFSEGHDQLTKEAFNEKLDQKQMATISNFDKPQHSGFGDSSLF